jgi:KipI family sensor histidine kinase inhibitor
MEEVNRPSVLLELPRFQPAGDSAVLVSFGNQIDPELNRQVHSLAHRLEAAQLPGLGELVPGYTTLLVHYDTLEYDYNQTVDLLRQHLSTTEALAKLQRRITIPVYYGGENGPDLAYVADYHHISVEEVIAIHSGTDYQVYMMGFMPGFPYLGGMNPAIATPRLATPRSKVPGGSVGIAGGQTGVYPLESPGGWQIIGRTPQRLFDLERDPPFLLAPGDVVRFVPQVLTEEAERA